MKLFSPRETSQETQKKQDTYVVEIAYLEKTLEILRKRLNTENQAFELRLKEQSELYGEEKLELQEEIKSLTKEIEKLEKRKEEALKPVNKLKKENEELQKDLQHKLKSVNDKEYELEEHFLDYTKKLDEISDRQCIIEDEEQKLILRKKAVQEEAEAVSRSHKDLNEKMASFYAEIQAKTEDLIKKENKLNLKEYSINQNYLNQKQYLDNQEKLLADKRGALERFAKEIGFNQK